jgi:hypothetical protein
MSSARPGRRSACCSATSAKARSVDALPPEVTEPLTDALVRSLDEAELRRAFTAAVHALLAEARRLDDTDTALAERIQPPLEAMLE